MDFGLSVGENRFIGTPSRFTRNLEKFHLIALKTPDCSFFRNFHRGAAVSPFTVNNTSTREFFRTKNKIQNQLLDSHFLIMEVNFCFFLFVTNVEIKT